MKRAFIATIIAVLFVHMVSAQTVVLLETFEGTFPQNNGWTVGGNATWAKVTNGFGNHVAASGNAFAYCAAIGNAGTPQNPVYPSSMNGYMGRAIDLTGNATATLSFWYMIPSIEECFHIFGRCDYFSVQIDGQEIYFDENPSLSWMPVSINLRPYGMTNHVVSFQFVSNGSFNHEGAYLDHIVILGQKTLLPNVLVNNPNA